MLTFFPLLARFSTVPADWLDAMPSAALPAAMKLMTVEQSKAVGTAVGNIKGAATEKEMFKAANGALDKCKKDVGCYLGILDTPVPSAPESAKYGHIKAVYMATEMKTADTKGKLLTAVEKIKDPSVRLALLEAIDQLSPQGDAAAAARLEKLVESDKSLGTDEMYRIAWKLRSRVP